MTTTMAIAELRQAGDHRQAAGHPQHEGEEVNELVGEETDGRTELWCGKLVRSIAGEAGPSLRRREPGGPGLEDVVHHFDRGPRRSSGDRDQCPRSSVVAALIDARNEVPTEEQVVVPSVGTCPSTTVCGVVSRSAGRRRPAPAGRPTRRGGDRNRSPGTRRCPRPGHPRAPTAGRDRPLVFPICVGDQSSRYPLPRSWATHDGVRMV